MSVRLKIARRQLDFEPANIHASIALSVCCVDRARYRDFVGERLSG